MSVVFTTLFAAHLLADFVLQTDAMVAAKRSARVMALHILIVGATSALLVGTLSPALLGAVMLSHLAMDAIKTHVLKPTLAAFGIDQAVHLAAIVIVAMLLPDSFREGFWGTADAPAQSLYLATLTALGGIVIAVPVGGIVLQLALKTLSTEQTQIIKGLDKGGRYIGWLERGLTLLFVAIDQFAAVGLLLAAKSILRFGDISKTEDRERAEYIIIGTFLSFGWAIAVSILTRAAVLHWIAWLA